ncbi:MAG: hypothetical protein WDZ75_00410 [Candidatus Paceibacterota bacterium]
MEFSHANPFRRATKTDLVTEPFPHLVVRNALDTDLLSALIGELPTVSALGEGGAFGEEWTSSNKRFDYRIADERKNLRLSPLLREILELYATRDFLLEFFRIFGSSVRETYPDFSARFSHNFSDLKSGIRYVDSYNNSDLLLDNHLGINTPVTATSVVRRVHVDNPKKLYTSLLYLRHPEDDSRGGDLILCRKKHKHISFDTKYCVRDEDVEVFQRIPYEAGTFVIILNTAKSLHGISEREPTKWSRHFIHAIGESEQPFFSLPSQKISYMARKLKRKFDRLLK